jgi:hypothetical protein
MKRSPALAPLSRDHHTALVVARDLTRASEADAGAVAERFVRFLSGHELAHFALEEALLLPDQPGVDFLHQIGRRLRAHVQLEEQEVFPYIEQVLEPAALDALGARLAREHDRAT